jgi:hypothetical protein
VVKTHDFVQEQQQLLQHPQPPAASRLNALRLMVVRRFGAADKMPAVNAALQSCSTEGVWGMQTAAMHHLSQVSSAWLVT